MLFFNFNSIAVINTTSKDEFASEEIVKSGKNKLVTFKFHVLDNAKFGETKIYEMDGEDSINCFDTNFN